jgi:osmotically-inducible protein OsmY
LRGTVEEPIDRELAEQVALNVSGVKTVDNQIKVDPNWTAPARSGDQRTIGQISEDATITASVKSKLLWNESTNGLAINVDTMRQRVTLTGTADSAEARALAGTLASNTDGVRSVSNRIEVLKNARDANRGESTADAVKADLSDAWVTTKVKSSFAYSKHVDALDINVDTKDGVVMLAGAVSSGAEKDLAVELADNVRGVKRVDASALKVVN